MSLYSEYIKERTHDHILEAENGFATYRYLNDHKTLYIIDIYVRPEVRKLGYAKSMADEIVEISKCLGVKEVIGSVVPSAKGSTASVQVLIAYGMKLQSSSQDFIVFSKEV